MHPVYLSGFGLASSIGASLAQALQQLHQPPAPQPRAITGLDNCTPYYAIDHAGAPAASWYARCASLICEVVTEAGGGNRSGALYLASSSLNLGAIEAGEPHPDTVPGFLNEVAGMLDWQGPVYWINTACTSSLSAILAAQDAIQSGCIEEAMIIGLELENRLILAGFAGMQLLSDQASMPFGAGRNGLVLGEAVAALRLSRRPGRWRITGGAQVIDSSQASGASTLAYQSMLAQTLTHAGLHAGQIDLIKVQAAGSINNDATEAQALCGFFTHLPSLPALLSLKPLIGHTLGASGAAEIALLLAMLEQRQWPECTLACDPALGVELATQAPEKLQHILAVILGFGGSHCCIALEDTDA